VARDHPTDDGEFAPDIEIARTIQHRGENPTVGAGAAAHAAPVGIAERGDNAHALSIIHHHT
jgi:hypothetical protein